IARPAASITDRSASIAGTFSKRTATVPRTVLSITTLTPAICASAGINTRTSARDALSETIGWAKTGAPGGGGVVTMLTSSTGSGGSSSMGRGNGFIVGAHAATDTHAANRNVLM